MRRRLLLAVLAAALAGCGGDDEPVQVGEVEATPAAEGSLPAWVASQLEAEGPDVALTMSTSDFAAGTNRVGFLVVRNDGSLVQAPRAEVLVGAEDVTEPVSTTAILEPLGPHTHPEGAEPHDHEDITDLYVAHVELPAAGRYWLVVRPEGEALQGVGTIDAREQTLSPAVGSKAIASDNPTLADAPAEEITTADPPDAELLRHSIADSLAEGIPFVVVFATPAFCQSRTCGPTVEVVDRVRQNLEGSGVRFIHVEIYEGNDPASGTNRWVKEWHLPTEPWVFLVGGGGVIEAKFEGSVAVDELEAAVREHLL